MPKPNKKRIEDRTEADLRAKGAGKIYIPDDLTIRADQIDVRTTSHATITDEELTRYLPQFAKKKKYE